MNKLSIKVFNVLLVLFLLISEGGLFLYFYKNSKDSISELLTNTIQTSLLNIKHYTDKNINTNGVDSIISHLDNIVSSSKFLENIVILDNNKNFIYSSTRSDILNNESCIDISNIQKKSIFDNNCYIVPIKVYKGLDISIYKGYVFLDKNYIDGLLSRQVIKILIYFSIASSVFILLYWFIQQKIIIKPLEYLRQYAYYNKINPKEFFISEFESIRYSLFMTFKRLKKEQSDLYKLSTIDPLSGLYNRLSLMEKLNWMISKSSRNNTKFAVIFLDLDNFKDINDSMGHNFGDKILKKTSKILLGVLRENDIISRIGGDEFIIVLPEVEDELMIVNVATRIKEELSSSVILEDFRYSVTASMGITVYPKDGKDVDTLLKNADIAMYKSKDLGKNSYFFFTNELNEKVQAKIDMQKVMQDALNNNNFKLYYQPKVDIKTGKIIGCEALIRLIDDKNRIISPLEFIPIAEENNFIIPLGKWVLKEAINQIKIWENTPLKDIKISINVSAKQFNDYSFVDTISKYIKQIDSSKLDIELTESVFIFSFEENFKIIDSIKKLGVTISLDDFGTGYSSLSYLKKIPFDTIKIDKSFIDDLEDKSEDKLFINMIVSIAKSLRLTVVAEGVENKTQLEYLKKIECDLYQGYLCSKPLKVDEFEALFINQNCTN